MRSRRSAVNHGDESAYGAMKLVYRVYRQQAKPERVYLRWKNQVLELGWLTNHGLNFDDLLALPTRTGKTDEEMEEAAPRRLS